MVGLRDEEEYDKTLDPRPDEENPETPSPADVHVESPTEDRRRRGTEKRGA